MTSQNVKAPSRFGAARAVLYSIELLVMVAVTLFIIGGMGHSHRDGWFDLFTLAALFLGAICIVVSLCKVVSGQSVAFGCAGLFFHAVTLTAAASKTFSDMLKSPSEFVAIFVCLAGLDVFVFVRVWSQKSADRLA